MRRPVVLIVAFALASYAIVFASSVASAQPSLSPPGMTPVLTPPTVQLTPAPTAERKDPTTAVLLSVGITTAGYIAMFKSDNESLQLAGFFGTYLGPSTGQWYAGQIGGLGLGLRAVGFVSMVYGFAQVLESECDYEYDDCSDTSDGDAGALLMVGGAGLWIGSTIYDVVLAKRAADSWNARHNVTIAPTMTADISGQRSPGLAFTGRF
ncbi:MAG TPA: hypothetical protein VL326_33425 [Kofleriaceae bacterium]|nr:hypothetical protein [Kofleriaceae bacterium]